MDIHEERRTELLWKRIVDLRSHESRLPIDDCDIAVKSGELSELKRLAEDTADVMNAELVRGRAAARDRLIRDIQEMPAARQPKKKSSRLGLRTRFSDRVLLTLALLLLGAAIAIAAMTWKSQNESGGACGISIPPAAVAPKAMVSPAYHPQAATQNPTEPPDSKLCKSSEKN